jgi:hypothetical protein
MTQQITKRSLQSLPFTFDFVSKRSAAWGFDYVADMIRRGAKGEPGYFYAVEAGQVLGTPPEGDSGLVEALCAKFGGVMMRKPEGGNHGGV